MWSRCQWQLQHSKGFVVHYCAMSWCHGWCGRNQSAYTNPKLLFNAVGFFINKSETSFSSSHRISFWTVILAIPLWMPHSIQFKAFSSRVRHPPFELNYMPLASKISFSNRNYFFVRFRQHWLLSFWYLSYMAFAMIVVMTSRDRLHWPSGCPLLPDIWLRWVRWWMKSSISYLKHSYPHTDSIHRRKYEPCTYIWTRAHYEHLGISLGTHFACQ